MANSWFKNVHNLEIQTYQGHWEKIMHFSNGIDRGEVIVITGEHPELNYEYLLDLFSFALQDVLYISYGHSEDEIRNDYSHARMHPKMWEFGKEKFVDVKEEFDINKIEKSFRKYDPDILFIENINWTDSFEEKIDLLKTFAKKHNIPIIVDVNPSFVDLDAVLNSKSLNKIYYFTNCSVVVYTNFKPDGTKISTTTFGKYFRIIEGYNPNFDAKDIAAAKKRFEQYKKQYKLCDWESAQDEQQQEQEKEKQKEESKELRMTFGH